MDPQKVISVIEQARLLTIARGAQENEMLNAATKIGRLLMDYPIVKLTLQLTGPTWSQADYDKLRADLQKSQSDLLRREQEAKLAQAEARKREEEINRLKAAQAQAQKAQRPTPDLSRACGTAGSAFDAMRKAAQSGVAIDPGPDIRRNFSHSQSVELEHVKVLTITAKAILIRFDLPTGQPQFWLPKSLIMSTFVDWVIGDTVSVEIPQWFANKEGIPY